MSGDVTAWTTKLHGLAFGYLFVVLVRGGIEASAACASPNLVGTLFSRTLMTVGICNLNGDGSLQTYKSMVNLTWSPLSTYENGCLGQGFRLLTPSKDINFDDMYNDRSCVHQGCNKAFSWDSVIDGHLGVKGQRPLLGSRCQVMEQYNELLRSCGIHLNLSKEVVGPSVNMTEEGKNKNNKQNKGKKRDFKEHGSGSGSNKKPKLEYWNVGIMVRPATSRGIAVVVIRRTQMLVVQERGLKTIPKTKTYVPVEDGSVLYMGDDHFAIIHGKESVVLEFSSGKSITLFNVLYVPKLRKNLISGLVLNKCGYKQVYESDKYILSKCGVFVGFGYYNNGMFMLNLNKVSDDSDSVYMSSSIVVNSSLWHARLGHVHYKRMLEISKDELIPAIDENPDKCTTCIMKDMGEADVILGIKIKRENKGIVITQSHYIEKILKKFNREDCSPVSTPMYPVEKLMLNTGKHVDQLEYSRAIGCLMYVIMSTRPDIAYAVGRSSR
ncbi:zinc finger, CCHC-type containing protein, partial [Tanacetum coccineum]